MKTKISTREFREKHKILLNSFHSPWPSFWGMFYLAKGYRYYSLNLKKKKVYLPILRKKNHLLFLGQDTHCYKTFFLTFEQLENMQKLLFFEFFLLLSLHMQITFL